MPSVETIRQSRSPVGVIQKPAGAMNSAFDTKPKRTYVLIDASKIEIRKNVPIPEVASRSPNGGARALLDRMGSGDMVELPTRQARGVVSLAKKLGVKVALRRLSDETSGVWRLMQRQHRPKTRAPHGCPEYTKRIAAYVTAAQKRKFQRKGGSEWLRKLIQEAR